MKKHLLMLFVAMMAATMSIKAQTIVIDDGFENGIQDSIWTQEFVVGQMPWAVEGEEDSLLYPATVYQGKKRAYLRNTTGETQGYVTRLVSKVMDLSPEKVYQPILSFWYANPKWTADRDTLRVLYKTSAKANWKQLAEYSSASAVWQKVSISLPEVGEYYQVAFEGKDNLGRGIVLDSVKLRSAPECTVPHDLSVSSFGGGQVNIAWNASWDANFFDLILAKDSIDPDTIANVSDSIIGLNIQVDGSKQDYTVQLESGEYYYAYVRSVCDVEKSLWNVDDPEQGQFHFRVKPMKNLPYSFGFEKDYNAGKISRDLEWTWGNNTGNFNPYINTHDNSVELKKYSVDGSRALVFSGANNNTTAIPAGQYAYAATPSLSDTSVANFKLSDCQVRFWSTVYIYTGQYAHSIIVGVMTDPEDVTTFVPVDTVSVWGCKTFQENIVSLENYQGEGTYVAFASYFDKQNLFYIDNVTVERRPVYNKVTKVTVNPRDTFATISWEGNAPSYKVVITTQEVANPNEPAAYLVDSAVVYGTNSYVCNKLEAGKTWKEPYYVYVQAEGTEWSYRYPFVTITGQKELPMKFDMEQTTGYFVWNGTNYPSEINIYGNDEGYPYLYTTNPYKGLSCLYLSKDPGNDSWVTFPMVDSIQHMQMTFYLSGSSTPAQTHAIVGVMSNPMEISTFVPVSEFRVEAGAYVRCFVDFSSYEGPDGVMAIVWGDAQDPTKNTINYIDEVTIEELSGCLPPAAIVSEATSDSITLSWEKSAVVDTWEVLITKSAMSLYTMEKTLPEILASSEGKRFAVQSDTIQWLEGTGNPTFGFGGLDWSTSYFVYVRAMCGDEASWWSEASVSTTCPEKFKLPYLDDFERYPTSSLEAGCWILKDFNGTGYPKILAPTSGAQSGNQLELWSTSTTHRNLAALPAINTDFTDVLFGFDARSYSATGKSVLYVGTMSDLNDTTTFVAFDTIYMDNGNRFYHVVYDMNDYQLPNNQIVITSGLGGTLEMNSDTYIDNVFVKSSRCAAPYDIHATDLQRNSMDIAWEGKTDDKWEVKVLSKYAKLHTKKNVIEPYDTANVAIINDTIVNTRSLHIDGLKAQTKYYIYIRPTCGDSIWAVDSIRSGCVKIDPTKPNKETFENWPGATSYNDTCQADCWTVGNGNPAASTTYIPFIYKNSTYAASGEKTYRLYPTATYSPTWVATPEIECNSMTELAITFSYCGSTSYYILPGVMTDPEDLSTFIVLDSIKGTGAMAQYTFDLTGSEYKDTIPANARYFAWRTAYNASPTVYIDDVSIIKVSCPLTKPSYSDLEGDRVRISSGLRTDDDWELLVTDSLIDLDSLALPNFIIPDTHFVFRDTIAQRSKLLTGLKDKTTYYAYTRSFCDTTISQWAMVSFTTPCLALTPEAMGVITFDEKEGYVAGNGADRYLPCWTIGNMYGLTTANRTPYIYNTSGNYWHNGNRSLEFYTSATEGGAYAITPQLNVDSIKNYQVNFWGTAWSSGAHKIIVGIVTDPSDLNTFVVMDTVTMQVAPNWLSFTIPFDTYEGDYLGNQGKYIMFLSDFGAANDVNITEISVEKIPTCRPVTEILVDNITADGAMLSWNGDGEKFRLLVADKELVDSIKPKYDKYLIDTIVSFQDSVLFGGLEPATLYYAYVQGICADNDSAKISMTAGKFFTNCPDETGFKAPYLTDFDKNTATGSGVRPDCWTGVYLTFDTVGTTQTYPQVSTSNAYSGKNNLYVYSYGYWNNTSKKYTSNTKAIAVAPLVQGNMNDYLVSFYARQSSTTTSYGTKLIIGYVTDATQKGIDSTFVKLGEVEVSGAKHTYYEFSLMDKAAIPAGARIALRADWNLQGFSTTPTANTSYYANFYVDNFRIGLPPTCYAPTLEAGKSTLTTAEVKITPNEKGGELWDLAVIPDSVYSEAGFDAKSYLDTVTALVRADSVNYVVPGLKDGTKYWVYARTVCGGDDGESSWSDNPIMVITKYYYKDNYFFGFEKDEGWIRSKNSTSDNYYLHPALETGYKGGAATTSYNYYPYSIENTSSYVYAYGPKDATKGKGALCLYAYSSSNYYGGYVIFPSISEPKARSFEFKVRPTYMSASTMKVYSSTYNLDTKLQIGTIDKDGDFESFELLATINLTKLNAATVAAAGNDFLFTSISLDLDSATMANKQIVLYQPQTVTGNTYAYNYIDNVTLDTVKGYGLVEFDKIKPEAQQATISWKNIGGPWDLYITSYDAQTKKTDTIASYLNLSEVTSQVVTGLAPQSAYTAILKSANAPAKTSYANVSVSKSFSTRCMPLEADAKGEFFWDFNEKSDWERSDVLVGGANTNTTDTCYWKPGCFTVGTTYDATQTTSTVYYNWLIQRKGYGYTSAPTGNASTSATSNARYEYGIDDSPALRVYTSTTYMTPYIVLPELNCSFDTMMIEFYGRCFCNYAADYGTAASQNKMVSATYLGASYSKSLVIGTLTDPTDFSTLEVIDTVTYNAYTSTTAGFVNQDPNGLRYWQKMMTPLSGAKGKYIVLFQPAYGLFFLDNLSVKSIGDNIFAPKNPSVSEITTTSAKLSWEVKHPTLQSVVVVLDADDKDKEIVRDTIVGTEYALTNLKPANVYKWYMYQINGANKSSETEKQQFITECLDVDPSYTTGFESDKESFWLVPGQTSATYKQNKCWVYGNAGTSAVGTNIYNYVNGTSSAYSHSGDYALRLYAYSTTMQTYAAMPAMDVAAYDTLQVNFWMCPGYRYPETHATYPDKISTQYTLGSTASTSEYYYAKSVIVGTMTDPNDPTTFVAIDTINYNGTFAQYDDATAANDYLFQKKKVALRGATGPYVAFMATLYAKGETRKSTYDYVWMDDISFSKLQECGEATDLQSSEITSSHAKLSWQSGEYNEEYVLQVSTDADFVFDTAFVFNDTVYGTYQLLDSLQPYTQYIWRIKSLCGEEYGVSEFSQKNIFTTARIPFFLEDFRETSLSGDWTVAGNPADEVIDSTDVEFKAATSASSYGFHRVTTSYGINGAHYTAPFYSSSATSTTTYDNYWLITPTIYLENDKTAHLTLDMALTQSSTSTPNANEATEANMADDFTFLIALSEDGGKTWKSENILGKWNNTQPAGSQLRDLPWDAENYRFDLSKYAGKNVRIAFYREALTYLSTTSAIHIGNIRVAYFDEFALDTMACQYQDLDVQEFGIFVDGDLAKAGKQKYRSILKAGETDAKAGALDLIYNLTVTYLEAPETIIADTICDGDSYTSYDFSGKTRSGVYRRKLQSAEHCDSIVTLRLFVAPIMTSTEQDTICFGKTYEWHGQQCNRTGLYTDTLVSIYGCDSIVYLNLTVRDQITAVDSVTICYGGSYNWNGNILSAAGIYKDTLESVDGCDSIVTMTVNVASILVGEPQKQDICEGNTFTWLGKVYDKAGTYRDTIQSADGCDSIAILELTVASTLRGEPEEISICRGESYKWNNAEYTQPGTYRDTLASSYGCDSIITLVLAWYAMEDTIYTQSQITVDELPFTYENPAYPYAAGQTPIFFAVGTEAGVYTSTVRVEGKHCETYMVHTLTIISTEGLEDVSEDGRGTRKVLYNDNLYIICNDEWYNAAGQKVSAPIK